MAKRLLAIALCAGVVAASFAAGTEDQKVSKPQTLRVQWWGSQTRHDMTLEVIKMYEQQNPSVKIEPEFLGWDGYWEKVATQAAGGDMADVVQMNLSKGWGLQYQEKGLLTNLQPYAAKGALRIDNVSPAALAPFQVNGGLYAIPLGTAAATFIYNEDMLKQAGVPAPTREWTWKDFAAAANTVRSKLGIYGMGDYVAYDIFPIYLREKGASLYSADGKKLGYSNDAYFTEFFKLKKELQDAKAMPTLVEIKQQSGLEDSFIVRKQSAMHFVYSNQVPTVSKAAGVVLKNAFIPGPDNKKGMSLMITMEFTAPTQGKNQEKAVNFIDYFVNDVAANKIMMGERGVPVSSKIRDALISDLQPAQKEMFAYISAVSDHCSPADALPPVKSAVVIQILKDVEEEILFGVLTPEAGAAKFRQLAEAALNS